jgi:hypothetical protein
MLNHVVACTNPDIEQLFQAVPLEVHCPADVARAKWAMGLSRTGLRVTLCACTAKITLQLHLTTPLGRTNTLRDPNK